MRGTGSKNKHRTDDRSYNDVYGNVENKHDPHIAKKGGVRLKKEKDPKIKNEKRSHLSVYGNVATNLDAYPSAPPSYIDNYQATAYEPAVPKPQGGIKLDKKQGVYARSSSSSSSNSATIMYDEEYKQNNAAGAAAAGINSINKPFYPCVPAVQNQYNASPDYQSYNGYEPDAPIEGHYVGLSSVNERPSYLPEHDDRLVKENYKSYGGVAPPNANLIGYQVHPSDISDKKKKRRKSKHRSSSSTSSSGSVGLRIGFSIGLGKKSKKSKKR